MDEIILRYKDIPPLTRTSSYRVDVGWGYLLEWMESFKEDPVLDLNPDFQRAHVWSKEQQIAYVEYALRDGAISGCDIYWNCPTWNDYMEGGSIVIVDGKQRLEAVTLFLANKIKAYGNFYQDFRGKMRMTGPSFKMHVNDLKTRAEILRWYLDFNAGGIAHTKEEIDKVRNLLAKEE